MAGPGSGKTELLSVRIARILQTQDTGPHNILALSFTEAAAKNLRLRLIGIIGDSATKVAIHTFHSLGREIISRYPEHFFDGAEFRPIDALGQIEIIEEILNELPHGHQFGSHHPELGFVYRKDLLERISHLKKAGLTPLEFTELVTASQLFLEQANSLVEVAFEARLSSASIPSIRRLVDEISELRAPQSVNPQLQSAQQELLYSLNTALIQAEATNKATSLSSWKQSHTLKDSSGTRCLKEYANIPKLIALAEIYATYQKQLYERALYDYDDMLLTAVTGIEQIANLKSVLQERYQFLLVDEFQDTNDAQMRLLYSLTDSAVNEGRPNILAVGDDDQSIYRFQGAEVTNLLKFLSWYREPEVITLSQNYRSGQPILDVASRLIERSSTRITNVLPTIEKGLFASSDDPEQATIINAVLPSRSQEFAYIAKQISIEASGGTAFDDIAIIARTHSGLVEMLPYLAERAIPVRYNREQDILRLPMIQELLRLAKFIITLTRANTEEADHLLPGILASPCWGIDQYDIWRLSIDAGRGPWMPLLQQHSNTRIQELARFFIDLSVRSLNEPLPEILSLMVGAPLHISPAEQEDEQEQIKNQPPYQSPFHTHYFSTKCLEERPDEYIRFLAALQTLTSSLTSYRQDKELHLIDLLTFVGIHERNGIALTDTTPYLTNRSSVQLLTAHGAKGLEFFSVYVLDAEQDVWEGSGKSNKIPLSATIAPTPSGDQEDDYLRLLFVALTRAKRVLTITRAQYGDDNKLSVPIAALDHLDEQSVKAPELITSLESKLFAAPVDTSSQALLEEILGEYTLNATDLNAFLDVTQGGPTLFLTERLLRFPQPRSTSASFGSAMHTALHRGHVHFKRTGVVLSTEQLINLFYSLITADRLTNQDDRRLQERGAEELAQFYPTIRQQWTVKDLSEFSVKGQGAVIGEVPVTGKLDLVRSTTAGWIVADYKTGAPSTSWERGSANVKRKMHGYRRQLLFYTEMLKSTTELLNQRPIISAQLLFTEQTKEGETAILNLVPSEGESEHIMNLVQAVHSCIQNKKFPETEHYKQDLSGIIDFEQDLINGKYSV